VTITCSEPWPTAVSSQRQDSPLRVEQGSEAEAGGGGSGLKLACTAGGVELDKLSNRVGGLRDAAAKVGVEVATCRVHSCNHGATTTAPQAC
jgi:hypothetical protein